MHNRRGTFKIKATKSSGLLDWANLKRMRNKISTAKKLFYSNKFIETNGNPVKRGMSSMTLPLEKPPVRRLEK